MNTLNNDDSLGNFPLLCCRYSGPMRTNRVISCVYIFCYRKSSPSAVVVCEVVVVKAWKHILPGIQYWTTGHKDAYIERASHSYPVPPLSTGGYYHNEGQYPMSCFLFFHKSKPRFRIDNKVFVYGVYKVTSTKLSTIRQQGRPNNSFSEEPEVMQLGEKPCHPDLPLKLRQMLHI